MITRFCSIIVLLVVGFQMFARGQNQEPNADFGTAGSVPVPARSGIAGLDAEPGGQANEEPPQIPALLGGQGTSLALTTEMERSNYLTFGMNVSTGYDDNALLTPSGQVGNTTFSVFPNIDMARSTSRMRWSFGYGTGLTVNQRLSNNNQGSHNLSFDSVFRLSPHVNLRATENFSLIAGNFGASVVWESGE